MKTILSTLLLAFISVANAQTIQDYKYVHIPDNLSGFPENKYQLTTRLGFYLEKKGYTILKDDKTAWPSDAKSDPCVVAVADVTKIKSLTTNKLSVDFKDCKNKSINSIEGTTIIKEYDKGFKDALQNALTKINESKPTLVAKPIPAPGPEIVKEVKPETITVKQEFKSNTFTNNGKTYQKVDFNGDGFMIMNENGTKVIARFEQALKPGIYRVLVTDGDTTYSSIGYQNGNSISYEVLENKIWKEIVLTAK